MGPLGADRSQHTDGAVQQEPVTEECGADGEKRKRNAVFSGTSLRPGSDHKEAHLLVGPEKIKGLGANDDSF